jgi:hypothetical protein
MTTLMVNSPAELISTVPFLIGFHPLESLVVTAMFGPRIAFAMRIDLPEQDTPEDAAQISVLNLAAVVLSYEPDAVAILGYGDEPSVTPAAGLLAKVFREARLKVVDELRVTDGRFWSYLCTDPTCCAAEGRPCPPADSVIAAEATFAGAVALPNREALEAQLDPVTGDDRQAMSDATMRALARRWPSGGEEDDGETLDHSAGRLAVREAERCYSTGGRLTDDDAAWLGLLLGDQAIRDYAWSRTGTQEWELALWSDLVRRVDPDYLPAPAALLAFVAMRLGQGALASIAVGKAREQDPDYSMAVLIERALMSGLPPSALDNWPALAVSEPEETGVARPPKADRTQVRTVNRPVKREKRPSATRRRS